MPGADDYEYQHGRPTWDQSLILPHVLAALREIRPDGSVLDLGCGNGALLAEIRQYGSWSLRGVEISSSGVEFARRQGLDVTLLEPGSKLEKHLPPESFDLVISVEVIEHVFDPRTFLGGVLSILRPGGLLLLTTPYHGYLKNLCIALAGRCDSHYDPLWDGGHIKFWSRRTLTAALVETGFTCIRFAGAGRAPYLWKSMVFSGRKRSW